MAFERGFDAMLRVYERGLDVVLKHRFITLMAFFATVGLSVYLFIIIPKGFFPQQDTGSHHRHLGSGAGYFRCRHDEASGVELGDIVLKEPGVRPYRHGDGRQGTHQHRPHVHHASAARRPRA